MSNPQDEANVSDVVTAPTNTSSKQGLQDWAHWASILAVIIAAFFGAYQLRLTARINADQLELQREIAANQSWGRFMELSLDHPEFTSSSTSYVIDESSFSDEDRRVYPWFVQYALFSGEQVLGFAENDPEWNYAIEGEATRHLRYLESEEFLDSELCSYSSDLRLLISRISPKINLANVECEQKLLLGASDVQRQLTEAAE